MKKRSISMRVDGEVYQDIYKMMNDENVESLSAFVTAAMKFYLEYGKVSKELLDLVKEYHESMIAHIKQKLQSNT